MPPCSSSSGSCAPAISSHRRRAPARSSSPASTAAPSGAARRSIPDSALLFVNSNEMPWIVQLIPNSDTGVYVSKCATCHREDRTGSPAAPSLVDIGTRKSRDEIAAIIREGTGRMPGFPDMGARNINDVVEFLMTGHDKASDPKVASDPSWLKYRSDGETLWRDPGRLSADRAAVGHAAGDRSQCRHDPVEDSVRRVPGARRQGAEGHRQRQLRRSRRHRRRPAVHRRDQLRQEVPRLRQAHGQAAVGNDAAGGRKRHALDIHREWPAVRRDRRGGGKNGAPSGSSIVAFALPTGQRGAEGRRARDARLREAINV